MTVERGWETKAACRSAPPGFMYPWDDQVEEVEAAKALCHLCSVRETCLEAALARREPDGIWGGYTFRERKRMIRSRQEHAARVSIDQIALL